MNILNSTAYRVLAALALWTTVAGAAPEPMLTVQVGAPAPPPTPLVNHGDTWHYHKGTNAPGAGWQTQADASLDTLLWSTGNGGFGYSTDTPNEVSLCQTILGDMINFYTTLYVRRSFEITDAVDLTRHLMLTMDWDDGFVAYLDGAELIRRNAGTGPDEPANTATASPNHESSRGTSGNAPMTFDLNAVGSRLSPGIHTLAIIALNGTPGSSDLVLLADLSLSGGAGVAGGGPLFAIVNGANTTLSGTNTIPGATRVTVNGEEAAFNPVTREWSRNHALAPGLNELFIAALNDSGALLASTNRAVLRETTVLPVSGVLSGNNVWDGANGTYRVTGTVIVPDGASLVVTNGAVVLFDSAASLRATTNGVIAAGGTEERPVLFAPANGATPWGDLGAFGANASLHLNHAEVVAGQIRPVNGGEVFIYDSLIRDHIAGVEMISANNGGRLEMSRSHALRFGEMDASETPTFIIDSLLERFAVDGLDIKGMNVPLNVIGCTIRYGDVSNGNADGLDFGPGAGYVDRCLIHDFPDKGISLGGAPDTWVSRTLIYKCGFGIAVNSSIDCDLHDSVISGCSTGLFFRTAGATGSFIWGTNNIIWGNSNNVVLTGDSTLALSYCDVQGGTPGFGNIDADPLFVNPLLGDYRLSAGSPARGAGYPEVNMGLDEFALIGGIPSAPFNLAAVTANTAPIQIVWQEDADNETGFELQRSSDGVNWTTLTTTAANATGATDATAALNQRYYYRARAVNRVGVSRYSNIASATRQEPNILVGGTLTADTTWSPAVGTVTVISTLTVPSGITLTVLPGTIVKVTNNASIIAAGGGTINIAATADNKVRLMPLNGTELWGQLSAQFAGSSLTVRHADISYAQVTVYSNAVGLLEDSFIHDYRRPGAPILVAPIVLTHFAAPTTIRRCHIREYHETLFRNGVLTIEECLFENIYGDGLDFDATQPGTVLRNCTFRHGTLGNVDAVDVGPGDLPGAFDVRIENCMMYDFPLDKGVSVGDNNASRGTIVSNCFIFACRAGVQAKDRCDVSVRQCTIVNNTWGFTNYNKVNPASLTGGGITTNSYNNILWNNTITISMANDSQLYADHNNFGNTNWPGEGNFDLDPLFLNPGGRDYRLMPTSPCIETGRDGADMGARFPVGAAMALSHPRIERIDAIEGNAVVRFWADNEKTYTLLCSPVVEGGAWTKLADVPLGAVPRYLSVTNALAPNNRFYRLVTPAQP